MALSDHSALRGGQPNDLTQLPEYTRFEHRTGSPDACAPLVRNFLGETLDRSVPFYSRHIFLCYKRPQQWPKGKLGSIEAERLPRMLAAAIRARTNVLRGRVQLSICEGDGSSDGDALVFPDMKRFKALTVHDLDLLVDEVLVSGRERRLVSESLPGVQLFVCCDPSRGGCCAQIGPPLVAALQAGVELRGWQDQVAVRACSHVGCQGDAGRVLVFSSQGDCSAGHWYGGVGLADVAALLDDHIGAGRIVEHLWRGQMAPPQGIVHPLPTHRSQEPCLSQAPRSAEGGRPQHLKVPPVEEKQMGAASPGSDGEVDESVLGYSVALSDSSEEGFFTSGRGGRTAGIAVFGRAVGNASFGSERLSVGSTGDSGFLGLSRSEGARNPQGLFQEGRRVRSAVFDTASDADVHSCSMVEARAPEKGLSSEVEQVLEEKRRLEAEAALVVESVRKSNESLCLRVWDYLCPSEGFCFEPRVQFGVSLVAMSAVVAVQVARKSASA